MSDSKYAGFWLRFVAYIIDYVILYVINLIILAPIMGMIGVGVASSAMDFSSMSEGDIVGMIKTILMAVVAGSIVLMVVNILYYTLMEASKFQGTVGKIALGLKVTDANGGKLDFVKALLRNVGKIVSGLVLMIGYIMAGFTEKKQALHDMFVGALVVKKK
jgi:uncharacterized RDD family membrane protein YckC